MTHTWNKKINKTPLIKRNNCKNNFLPLKKKKLLEQKHFEEIKKKDIAHRIPIFYLSFYANLDTM